MKKALLYLVIAGVVGFALIQLIPFGHAHNNPAVVSEPAWVTPQARALAKEHCFQCHSNETDWPWYSNVAPASWLISFDVAKGRNKFNFSDWKNNPGELREITEAIQEGEMPPIQYWVFHPNSHLTAQQRQELIQAMQQSLK